MKLIPEVVVKKVTKVVEWLEKQIVSYADNIVEEGRSLRVILNWVYCFFYLWLVWYGATHYKECIPTAIVSTSTLVGAIFTGYVLTKSYEKVKMREPYGTAKPKIVKPTPEEDGASD